MAVFGLSKKWFDPDTAVAIRFLVGFGYMVASDAIQIVLIDTAAQAAPLFARGTIGFERTVITIFGACPIASLPLRGVRVKKVQFFACWTNVDITLSFIAEAIRAKELGAMVVIGQRDVGTNMLVFNGDNVLLRAVFAVTSDLSGPQLPTKARPPKQIEHRLIFHHFGRRH